MELVGIIFALFVAGGATVLLVKLFRDWMRS